MEQDVYLKWILNNLANVWDEKEGLTKQNIIGTLVLFQYVFSYDEHEEAIWNAYEYFDKAIKIIKMERNCDGY